MSSSHICFGDPVTEKLQDADACQNLGYRSCAAEARQVDGYWQVPEVPQPHNFGELQIRCSMCAAFLQDAMRGCGQAACCMATRKACMLLLKVHSDILPAAPLWLPHLECHRYPMLAQGREAVCDSGLTKDCHSLLLLLYWQLCCPQELCQTAHLAQGQASLHTCRLCCEPL